MASSKKTAQNKGKPEKSDRLPFEPKSVKASKKAKKSPSVPQTSKDRKKRGKRAASQSSGIPEVVSKRMAKRMAVFCGIPTLMGIAILPSSYFLITREIVALPNTAVLLASLLCLGLSVLGLTYGVVSASWDESDPGSLMGLQEFQLNWKRMTTSWKERS